MAKAPGRVTSADVARASGVSRATVSYVLNNDPKQSIPPETRERVLKEASKLGYSPFTPARILRAGYSRLVLAAIPFEMVDPGIARDLKMLEAGLAVHGYSLISYLGLHNPSGHPPLSANLTPAVIAAFANEADPVVGAFLKQFNAPVIPLFNPGSGQPVGQTQVSYLVQGGQSRIIYAAPERRDVQWLVQARLEGVRQRCAELGLEKPLVQIIPGSRQGAQEAIADLLTQQAPPFGVCCYNDEVAFAVMAGLSSAGIPIPQVVAVIGCDDIPLAQFSAPPLTTLAAREVDKRRLLELRIENILAASRGEPVKPAPLVQLLVVVRESA
jgi:DNA-binding LacI/PurR family transcriptional regulator